MPVNWTGPPLRRDQRAALENRRSRPSRSAVSGGREHPQTPWPTLLNFWGLPNLQVINREAHRVKCAAEARSRGQNAQVSLVASAVDLDGRAPRPT